MYIFTKQNQEDIDFLTHKICDNFPHLSKKDVYKRIFKGYCYGEGGFPIHNLDIWLNMFNGMSYEESMKSYLSN